MAKAKKVSATPISEDTKTLVTVLLLIFVTPLGLILMWFWTKWKLWVKLLVTLPVILFFLALFGTIFAIALLTINPTKQLKTADCTQACSTVKDQPACVHACMIKYGGNAGYDDIIEEEEVIQ